MNRIRRAAHATLPPLLFAGLLGCGDSDDRGPVTPGACADPWPLERIAIVYNGPNEVLPDELLDAIATRFRYGIGDPTQVTRDLLARPGSIFRGVFRYNSLTDNYVTSTSGTPEHDWLVDHAAEYGVTDDGMYLHYWEDTTITLQGETIEIPGWGSGGAAGPEEARIPVYYADLSRRATHFGTPEARALHRAYNVEEVANRPVFDDVFPVGIMFDNSATTVYNFGTIESGGAVREHPTHAVFGSADYRTFHWEEGIGLFMKELRDELAANPDLVGGRSLELAPNNSNTPSPAYGTDWQTRINDFLGGGGFMMVQEFQYSPTRNTGADTPPRIHAGELASHQVGIDTFHPGFAALEAPGYDGSYSREQAAMNNLGLEWVIRSSDDSQDSHTYFLGVQVNAPGGEEWETNLLGAFDADLGRPEGDPFLLAEGTDGKGYEYQVWARRFACGMAAVRMRGGYDQDIDEATGVRVDLGGSYVPLEPTGHARDATTRWTFRNGSGQIFVAE